MFEMGADFGDSWQVDNKEKKEERSAIEIKPPEKHRLHFAKERRRGKVVTIVKPFYLERKALQSLLKRLKKMLGTGGTIKADTLEFQGDVPQRLRETLEAMHYRFR